VDILKKLITTIFCLLLATNVYATSLRDFNDPFIEIPAGNITGKSSVNKFGRSSNVDNGVDTDIWDRANATDDDPTWNAPTAATVATIVSDDVDDDGSPVGNGARTVKIVGLDANFDEQEETVTMDGTSGVNTTNTFRRVFRMIVLTSGASTPNEGTITCTVQGQVTAQIQPGMGQTLMAVYTVPNNATGFMTGYYAALNKSGAGASVRADIILLASPPSASWVEKHRVAVQEDGTSYFQHSFKPYVKFEEKTDLRILGNGSANNLDVTAGFDIIIVDD